MDIYNYFNSRDVADYCRKINKQWTPFEMASIIGRNYIPIAEKHKAWRELIAEYPDVPTPEGNLYESFDSLHSKLIGLIDYEERALELFKTPESGAVYRYSVWWKLETRNSDDVFTTLEKAAASLHEGYSDESVNNIMIYKVYADERGKIEVCVDYDGNPYYISVYAGKDAESKLPATEWEIDEYYLDIPVPFKRGDLLTKREFPVYGADRKIFVAKSFSRDDERLHARLLRSGDFSDMQAWGLMVSEAGAPYEDNVYEPDSFEYYHGKLEGNARLLHYVSLYMKDEIGLPELLTMQSRILMENLLKNELHVDMHGCYIPEKYLI